jgi:hypothetical protein
MKKAFSAGTIVLKNDVRLPDGVKIETEPCAPGWKVITNMDGYALDRAIRKAGGNFFCVADAINVRAAGIQGPRRTERGVKKLAAHANKGQFNALEIMTVSAKSFLGVPYVKISARSRHIQQSMFLVPQLADVAPAKDAGIGLTPVPALV